MVAIRYYRQYLWIFFYMFFFLMAAALAFDSYAEVNSGSSGDSGVKLPRFMTVFVCFLFAGIGIVMQHFSSRGLLGLRFLHDRRKWFRRKMKVRRRWRPRKFAKKRHVLTFCFVNSLSNLIVLIPLIVVYILQFTENWDDVKSAGFPVEFFCIALLIKYGS